MQNVSVKYPRTPHLPFSPAYRDDDEMLMNMKELEGKLIVVTEKMDGENTTIYPSHFHARSINEQLRKHDSRDWMKNFWNQIANQIPSNCRICGENLYAKHSIQYDNLDSYFLGFSMWYSSNFSNVCLDWDSTLNFFEKIGIHHVPVLYRGKWDWSILTNIAASLDLEKQEGFVVRLADEFCFDNFSDYVGKWVRKNHVEDDKKHWFNSKVTRNGLKTHD